MMHGYTTMAGGWLWMGLVGLFWITVIVLTVWGVSRLFPRNNPSSSQHTDDEDALHILKRRYARGEMSRSEFEEARSVLE
jgi:uncharacterized membrane protein